MKKVDNLYKKDRMQSKIMKINPIPLLFVILSGVFSASIYSITPEQEEILSSLPPELQAQALNRIELQEALGDKEVSPKDSEKQQSSVKKRTERERLKDEQECEEIQCIFGYDIFRDTPISFVSTIKAPITASYLLGPGDLLKVNYFGSNSRNAELEIDNNGNFDLPLLGPVNISGLNIEKAQQIVSEKVEAELIGTKASISLSELRSITVFILGEANLPGSYTLDAFSTVTNALFSAGGVNKMGSLRNIKVNRDGKLLTAYDFYDFLLKGDSSSDIRLQDGDIVFIPFIENKVHFEGPFKRPATYEFLDGETLAEAIDFAGGFLSPLEGAQRLGISSIDDEESIRSNKEFSANDLPLNLLLKNGDLVTINGPGGFEKGSVELKGEVLYPGVYSFVKGERLLSVINRAGGYSEYSFTEGAVFTRKEVAKKQKEGFERMASSLEQTIVDMVTTGDNISEFSLQPINSLIQKLRKEIPVGRQVIDANLLNIKQDPFKNFTLRDGDMLLIPQRPEYINIVGEVLNPNTLRFNPALTVMDYLERSGGLTDTADEEKIFVIRPNGTSFLYKKTLFKNNQNLLPGSTVVVPRDSKPFDAIKITQIITPILADLATSAAAIAAISD